MPTPTRTPNYETREALRSIAGFLLGTLIIAAAMALYLTAR